MNLFSTIQALLDDSDLIKKEQLDQKEAPQPQKKTYSKPYSANTYNKKPENKTFEKKDFSNFKSEKKTENKPANNCYGLYPKDGDTFVGMYQNEKLTFRLAGIDAPERDEAWAKESTKFLRQYIEKKVLFLEFKGKDKYDRHIVEVFIDKEKTQSVNRMLIQNGLATSESYKNNEGDNTHGIIEHAVNEASEWKAKLTNKGMWS